METETELQKVKRRIRLLSDRTVDKGCSEAEMFSAMNMIGKLLEQFNLEMTEVMLLQEQYVTEEYETGSKHKNVLFHTVVSLASFTQTKVWIVRGEKISYKFFGAESDVKMAIYLCKVIDAAYDTEYELFKASPSYAVRGKVHGRVLYSSFTNAMGCRIGARLRELAAERLKTEKEAAEFHATEMKNRMVGMSDEAAVKVARMTTGTALVVMSDAKAARLADEYIRRYRPKTNKDGTSAQDQGTQKPSHHAPCRCNGSRGKGW